MKKAQKILSLAIAMVMIISLFSSPIVACGAEGWSDNPYYQMYQNDYIPLFKAGNLYLKNEPFDNLVATYFDQYTTVMERHENETFVGAFLYALGEGGLGICINDALADIGIGSKLEERMRMSAVTYLVNSMNSGTAIIANSAQYYSEISDWLSTSYDFTQNALDDDLLKQIAKSCKYISYDTIKNVAKSIEKNRHFKNAATNIVSAGPIFCNMVMVYSVEMELIEQLQNILSTDSVLYDDLENLKNYYMLNAQIYFIEKLSSEWVMDTICEYAISQVTGSGGLATIAADITINLLVEGLYQGALANELVQAMYLYCYACELQSELKSMQNEFATGTLNPTKQNIEIYEFTFNAYISAVRAMLVSVRDLENNVYIKRTTDQCINSLDTYATYKTYVEGCINIQKEKSKSDVTKTQYRYYHYVGNSGEYACCPYYGKGVLGWTSSYREDTGWLDEPLKQIGGNYQHVHQGSACIESGCIDTSWYKGGKYIDSNGVYWYRQETRTVPAK